MARPSFTLELLAPGTPQEAWARLWDLDRHSAAVPLTTVTGPPLDLGSRFCARTALGPVGFDDEMVVREWDPPQRAVIDKTGPVLTGSITVELTPAEAGTRVRWNQSYGAARVPDAAARILSPAVRTAYLLALRRITRP